MLFPKDFFCHSARDIALFLLTFTDKTLKLMGKTRDIAARVCSRCTHPYKTMT